MKFTSIVALLGLAAGAPAFAAPFVQNTNVPSVINPAPGTEQNLQTIVDGLFGPGHVNVNTDQSSAGMFASSTPSAASTIPTLVAEFTANASTQVFGIWFGTNTTNVVTYDLLNGGATAGDNAALSFSGNTLNVGTSVIASCGVRVNCGSFTNALVNPSSFGFYFKASPSSQTYYSLDQLNAPDPRTDRVVSFRDGTTTNWVFAYEDGSDFDYNDMAVKVESITVPVPEPESYALMLAGLAAMGVVARRRRAPR